MGEVIAVIPARSGSKSIKDKNIRVINGKPLLAYSIEQALKEKTIDRVIVSTDSERYREIAKLYGAEAPFLRPLEISGDQSLDIEVFQHLMIWLEQSENKTPDIFVHLRPTHPVRESGDIDRMVEIIRDTPEADSIRSMSPAKQIPYKMWLFDEKEMYVSPVAVCDVKEAYNAPRQSLPKVYMQNACIDVVKSRTIKGGSMTGTKILGYPMDYDFDVDTEEEFLRAEKALLLKETLSRKEKLIICCDIDGVIAAKTIENDYSKAVPLQANIQIINRLADQGHKVILHTARGYVTGIDWEEITRSQMDIWGVKYSELKLGKPNADIYLDDKYFEFGELNQLLK